MLVTKVTDTIPEEVYDMLGYVGLPPHLKGYDYIAYAITLTIQNPDIIHAITKELYPETAKAFDTTNTSVERAIRHSIEYVFLHGDYSRLREIFQNTISPSRGSIVNSQFIATLAKKLRRIMIAKQEEPTTRGINWKE